MFYAKPFRLFLAASNLAQAKGALRVALLAAVWLFTQAATSWSQVPAVDYAPALQAYSVEPGQLAEAGERLKTRYAANGDVRIAIEPRSSKLVVMAPPAVHMEIAAWLKGERDLTPLPETQFSDSAVALQPSVAWRYRAEHLDGQQLLRLVEGVPGVEPDRSLENGGQDRSVRKYRLVSRGRTSGTLSVDLGRRELDLVSSATERDGWKKVMAAYDRRSQPLDQRTTMVSVRASPRKDIEKVVAALASRSAAVLGEKPAFAAGSGEAIPDSSHFEGDLIEAMFRRPILAQASDRPLETAPASPQGGLKTPPAGGAARPMPGGETEDEGTGLVGQVQLEFVEGLDVIIVRGSKRDVERVSKMIAEIEKLSAVTKPVIVVHPLKHVESVALADLVRQLYDQALAPRQGRVSYTALGKPNALLLIGQAEGVEALIAFVEKLDTPVAADTQFEVLRLKHMPASDAEQALKTFYENRGGLGVRARVLADFRSNSLLVQASPRDVLEIAEVLRRLDVAESASASEVRVFRLKNSLATEMAPVMQQAINGSSAQGTPSGTAGQPFGGQTGATGTAGQRTGAQLRSAMLQLAVIDPEKGKVLKSGILTDVKVTADSRSNSLVVTGPAESMELIAALVESLDSLPGAGAVLKVFTIVNGDATSLASVLQQVFGTAAPTQGQGGGGQAGPAQTATGQGESTLVGLRFGVDTRTNSIISSGSPGDLKVVEAILLRLDEGEVRQRRTEVYRLRNAPATDVATAINQFLTSQRQLQQLAPGAYSPFEQLDREVVVVPEQVSNSLIVSATPRYFDELRRIVNELDARPPMVLIQVLIGEVSLDATDEFGLELGLQDSLLFSRSVLTDVVTPGFNFNNQPLGNAASATSLATKNNVAGQAISSFALGRTNSTLGYGGLVLSASSDAVSALLRALQERRRIDVLARPQVMTLDNQPAFVQVGARVPRITSTQQTTTGTINNTVLENVGLILGVTPRISPDGLVVMEIDAERSELGPESEGVPISINASGDVIRSPQIKTTTAQTTVSARTGQTIVLGGLISKTKSTVNRKAPWLGEVPVLGNLFRYDNETESRRELLIVMTPHIVRSDEDVENLRQLESQRMSWCLADVHEIHGRVGLSSRCEPWSEHEPVTIFPDEQPALPPASLLSPKSPLPSTREPPPGLPSGAVWREGREALPLPAPRPFNELRATPPAVAPLPDQSQWRLPPTGAATVLPATFEAPANAWPTPPPFSR